MPKCRAQHLIWVFPKMPCHVETLALCRVWDKLWFTVYNGSVVKGGWVNREGPGDKREVK